MNTSKIICSSVLLLLAGLHTVAATLSHTKIDDYVITRSLIPTNCDIRGIGIGTRSSNTVMRAEDVLFLREAFAERSDAVRPPVTSNDVRYVIYVPVPNKPWIFTTNGWSDIIMDARLIAPESFDHEYFYISRGDNNSFVDPSFRLVEKTLNCSTNFTFRIPGLTYEEQRCKDSYLPYLANYSRLSFTEDELAPTTNVVPRLDVIRGKYSALAKLGNVIVSAPADTVDREHANGSLYDIRDPLSTRSLNPVLSEKVYNVGGSDRRFAYISGATEGTWKTTYTKEKQETVIAPLVRARFRDHAGWKVPYNQISPTFFEPYTMSKELEMNYVGPFVRTSTRSEWDISSGILNLTPRDYTQVSAWCEIVTNIDEVSFSDCYVLAGFRWKTTRKRTVNEGSIVTPWTINVVLEEKCAVSVKSFSPVDSGMVKTFNDVRFPILNTGIYVADMWKDAYQNMDVHFGDPTPGNTLPNVDDLPKSSFSSTPVNSGFISAEDIVENSLDCEWISVVFVFSKQFKATFSE